MTTLLNHRLFRLGLAFFGVLFLTVQIAPPAGILSVLYASYALRSGVHATTLKTDQGDIQAYEGGVPKKDRLPVLLLHGFGDSKISFVQSARWLTQEYQVLLPEFPGFGESPQDPKLTHSIRAQVERVRAMLDARNFPRAHLVGNSMGGHIAAAFSLRYPDRVASLTLISPAGLRVDDPIPYRPQEHAISTEDDYDRFMDQLFYKRPWIPGPFKKDFIRTATERFEWLQKVRAEIRDGEDYILNDRIAQIRARTFILWGQHDGVVHVAHAPVWKAGIAGSKLVIQEDSGHSPQYEYPERTGKQILEFLNEPERQ